MYACVVVLLASISTALRADTPCKSGCTILRVRSDTISCSGGSCDGSNWGTEAYNGSSGIQSALYRADYLFLNELASCVEIWIAGGTYKPSVGGGRARTYTMRDYVSLYGGFAVDDDECTDRDNLCSGGTNAGRPCETDSDCPSSTCPDTGSATTNRIAVLSGDIDGDDPNDFSDNVYHVVTYNLDGTSVEVVIDGLVIKGGYADGGGSPDFQNQGGAITIRDGNACLDGGPTIANCMIRDNYAADHSAVNIHGSQTLVDNCVFKDNESASEGGAITVDNNNGSVEINNTLFVGNAVTGGERQGGAVWIAATASAACSAGTTSLSGTTALIHNCYFDSNTAGSASGSELSQGGAVWIDTEAITSDAVTIRASQFVGNAARQGGGVWSTDTNLNIISGTVNQVEVLCTFESNRAFGPSSSDASDDEGSGGGLWASWSGSGTEPSITINDAVFEDNDAVTIGGAISFGQHGMTAGSEFFVAMDNVEFTHNTTGETVTGLSYRGGGAIWMRAVKTDSAHRIQNCRFFENHAMGYIDFAGGINAFGVNDVTFENCEFIGNTSASLNGGAFYGESNSPAEFLNCLFVGNSADNFGGAIAVTNSNDVTLVNCTVVNNCAANQSNGTGVYASGDLVVTNSIVQDNQVCESGGGTQLYVGGTRTVTYTCLDYTLTGTGNIVDDPEFVEDPSGCDADGCTDYGDLHLTGTSPCVDAGSDTDVSWDYDLDGDDRMLGAAVDMGADELACAVNGDCPSGETCDTTTDECECNGVVCSVGDYCCNNQCADCCNDGHCGLGKVCCNGTCCATGQSCCNGSCCTGVCCNNSCCSGVCCNNACYTGGECCTTTDCRSPGYECCANHLCMDECLEQ
jgi:hypothetical protein